MKQLIKIICIFIISIFVFSVIAQADYSSSVKKQKELNTEVMELLKANNLDKLREYIYGIKDCGISEDGQTPEFCTFDRIDGKDFVTHVLQGGFRVEHKNFTIVSPDIALYEALKRYYISSYKSDPRTFNLNNYSDFYSHYKNTWLKDITEKVIIKMWQRGDFFDKYSNFSCMTGVNIYTTVYISHLLKFDSIFKYTSPEISFNMTGPTACRGRLHTILNEMKRKADETNSHDLLKQVVSSWFNSLSTPEIWDETEQQYYKGKKQQRMYDMFNEEGWDMFAGASLTPTAWQKHTITLYVHSCMRVINDVKRCSAFEQGAIKHGFYTPYEQAEEQLEDHLADEIERVSSRLDKGFVSF
ncbi:MAG: hypothetical protein J6S61_04035 [Elusimicrobiaceae bacterium]|nr:hypothetical protein [Elusimicrobiaceae bacterium]